MRADAADWSSTAASAGHRARRLRAPWPRSPRAVRRQQGRWARRRLRAPSRRSIWPTAKQQRPLSTGLVRVAGDVVSGSAHRLLVERSRPGPNGSTPRPTRGSAGWTARSTPLGRRRASVIGDRPSSAAAPGWPSSTSAGAAVQARRDAVRRGVRRSRRHLASWPEPPSDDSAELSDSATNYFARAALSMVTAHRRPSVAPPERTPMTSNSSTARGPPGTSASR